MNNNIKDNRLYPRQPIPTVSAVVIRDGRVLMIKRANEPNKGKWSIPGGRLELGETTFEAARREVSEECGIEIKILRLLDVASTIIRDNTGRVMYHYVLIDYLGEYISGEVTARSDAVEYRWVTREQLAELDIADQLRELLERVISGLATAEVPPPAI
jgi:ADP-ribose pyrophosphatase